MRTVGSIVSVNFLGQSVGTLAVAVSLALASIGSPSGVEAAQYRPVQTQTRATASSQRYVSQTTRRVAVPVRNQRAYSAPRGATLLRSRYWDPRTRWMVDPRTHSSYSVLSNGEVWFLEPSSGWAYTVDRYGRVYGADPRRNSIYAFSSLNSWRGDLFYFFDFFSPYDGYYTVRDYDWFYSSYYGRRTALFDYGYAYNSMWSDFGGFWGSNRFYRSINFRYYDPQYIRYGSGWNSNYYRTGLPAVYIAPCYSYTVVNNTVVVNNNYYTNNNIVNTGGRGLPTAQQAAVQLSQQVAAPTVFAGNEISSQQIAAAGITAPIETVKEVSVQEMLPVVANEPVFEVPGLAQPTPGEPVAPVASEPVAQQPVDNSAEKNPGFSEPVSESGRIDPVQPIEPIVSENEAQKQAQPIYAEPITAEQETQPILQEPTYESQKEVQPSYEESAPLEQSYEQPAYQEQPRDVQPSYEDQKEPSYEQPNYETPQEQSYEQPSYEDQKEQSYEQPAYEAPQEQSYEQPSYEAQKEQSYEQPAYEAPQEQSYEQPSYEAPQEQSYEQPSYEAPREQSYEQPSYEAPQEQRSEQPSYEAPQEQRYEQPSDEAPPQEQSRNEESKSGGM